MSQLDTLRVDQVAAAAAAALGETATVVVGMEDPLRLALAAVLAGGHVLFEDLPGLGKTLAAKSLAAVLGLEFRRLQCTPDLLPSDITGSSIFNPAERTFEFRPGPVFTGLFLADEINRTSPKTQSALLEAMAEKQVSVEGRALLLPKPFHVFATANPIEFEGTYPLPEAQLDRFLVRLAVGYPGPAGEQQIIARRLARRQDTAVPRTLFSPAEVLALQSAVEAVDVQPDVVDYAVRLAAATRNHADVEVGASPRGSQGLVLMARALAAMDGRPFVLPEDIKFAGVPVLAHRLTLTPSAWARGASSRHVVEALLGQVPTPVSGGTRVGLDGG